ncbi:hypothetical protein HN358_00590 [Candidatus Uhrbacteria bacterium]|jgi:hypothetical protein|nr:hypothetical protein [Candidatus Uhrbacteria bacterium]MBT7717382.1 hypothetical protein [Candidatus Uhrbacteria bacterium]
MSERTIEDDLWQLSVMHTKKHFWLRFMQGSAIISVPALALVFIALGSGVIVDQRLGFLRTISSFSATMTVMIWVLLHSLRRPEQLRPFLVGMTSTLWATSLLAIAITSHPSNILGHVLIVVIGLAIIFAITHLIKRLRRSRAESKAKDDVTKAAESVEG